MIDLHRYFLNPFDDKQISLIDLISYSTTHLSRMVANNPGAMLNARITATTTALTSLDACMSDNEVKLALRKARVQAKETFREALPANIAKIHGAVVAAFGPNAPQVTECFPQGRNIFGSCPDDVLDDKLEQLQACLAPLAAQVGQIHVDNVAGLLSTWLALSAAAQTAAANKNSVEATRRACRAALQLELFKNLITLAMSFPNDESKADLYCPQYLLENGPGGVPEQATFSVAESQGEGAVHLAFAADGATSLQVWHKGPDEEQFTLVETVESDQYTKSGLPGGTHEYKIVGLNSRGEGPASEVRSIQVAAAEVA